MAKDPPASVPGAGHGPPVIVPKKTEDVDDAEKTDPPPPTVPGGQDHGPQF